MVRAREVIYGLIHVAASGRGATGAAKSRSRGPPPGCGHMDKSINDLPSAVQIEFPSAPRNSTGARPSAGQECKISVPAHLILDFFDPRKGTRPMARQARRRRANTASVATWHRCPRAKRRRLRRLRTFCRLESAPKTPPRGQTDITTRSGHPSEANDSNLGVVRTRPSP